MRWARLVNYWPSDLVLRFAFWVWHQRLVHQRVRSRQRSDPSLRGNKIIIKVAWRNSGRTSESDIYREIQEDKYSKGLARFEFGGDVLFPLSQLPFTVRNLRNEFHQDLLIQSNATSVFTGLFLVLLGAPCGIISPNSSSWVVSET
ncbi:hypothetical protein B0H34DRAFT_278267 [Crassisporium funariophilum]|nr:hypothetical protein B0H34DRAFT_278267 [Crassisporium funariophilum]